MATLQDLRLEAHLSITALSKLAKVDRQTLERAESGTPVQDVKAYQIVEALSQKLGRKIELREVEGLHIL